MTAVGFTALPDPGLATGLDGLARGLRALKVWAGDPSYGSITNQVNRAWTAAGRPPSELTKKATVVDCFKPGRRRLNTDLVIAIVHALHPDTGYVAQWRQALQVIGGTAQAAAQVRIHDTLPPALASFTGRERELDLILSALGRDGVVAITGMAGVGKTQLAIRAGQLAAYDRVLLVNLRGFHPDPAQPPADPGAVLDGFLHVLDVQGGQIPHRLPARVAAYRARLAGTRTLVILDDAADEEQVRPLLPQTPGCLALVTSRRRLDGLLGATYLTVDAFTPAEATAFLGQAGPTLPVGEDSAALDRIARRCGHLPLALGLVAGQLHASPGWTLSDHADRLDERRRDHTLDSGVQIAFDVSYQNLAAGARRLLRLAALLPGQDVDVYAAAALIGADLATAQGHLEELCRDHLVQPSAPGRYTLHDLVRGYAAVRSREEDRPPERRAALTRAFDHYLAAGAAAMTTLHPAQAHHWPRFAAPGPNVTDPGAALAWLDVEHHTLVAVAGYAATHGWPRHAIDLSAVLYRYLERGHHRDALTVHGYARDAAAQLADPDAQAHALTSLGPTYLLLGRHGCAADHLHRALELLGGTGNAAGRAHALGKLGTIDQQLGRYNGAANHHRQALALWREASDEVGEAHALNDLGFAEGLLGRYESAAGHFRRALALFRTAGDLAGEATTLTSLGIVKGRLGRQTAAGHFAGALALCRQAGDRTGEAWTLDSIGSFHTLSGRPDQAVDPHRQALVIHRENGQRAGEACSLNGLGEAAVAARRWADAIDHHRAARAIAADTGDRYQQARTESGLGLAHRAFNHVNRARCHLERAAELYAELGLAS